MSLFCRDEDELLLLQQQQLKPQQSQKADRNLYQSCEVRDCPENNMKLLMNNEEINPMPMIKYGVSNPLG